MPRSTVAQREAVHGKKMIELRVRFWTNDIAEGGSQIVPKHAWASGVVRIEKNDLHGIRPGKTTPFQSLLDLGKVIEKTLIDHDIQLHVPRQMAKYVVPTETKVRKSRRKR